MTQQKTEVPTSVTVLSRAGGEGVTVLSRAHGGVTVARMVTC